MDVDLFLNFRGFLILGRCLGLLPFNGVLGHSFVDLKYRRWSSASLHTAFCVLLLLANAIISVEDSISLRKRNPSEIADSLRGPMFAFWGLFIYIYFLFRGQLFLKIFQSWTECHLNLTYTRHDKTLKWTIILVSVVMFSSTILENAVLHLEYFPQFDNINGHDLKYGEDKAAKSATFWENYYRRAHPNWNELLGSHPILAVLAFLAHKFSLYGGNYMDMMMALFSRALYFKFQALYKTAEEVLIHPLLHVHIHEKMGFIKQDLEAWIHLVKDHDALCDALQAMNNFFSPLIFVSYTVNIYFFCMQLLTSLSSGSKVTLRSVVLSIYSPWSFVHVIVRIFILSLFMARINEYAHNIRKIVARCPIELYSGWVAKLGKRVNIGPPLGMSGIGCFTVTKPFMLNILNVVFTIEIVLLQGLDSNDGSSPTDTTNDGASNSTPQTNATL